MKFDKLDIKLRIFETTHDLSVMPEIFMIARIDGRNFTRLTKDIHSFEAPYDERFRDYMIATIKHLMNCGFRIIYGYTQSDEISLLFHRDEDIFNRKLRKLNSVLAGEASAKFSVLLGDIGAFDCRISQLPTLNLVVDYFRWRNEDAHRNALNAHCYWILRKEGMDAESATQDLHKLSVGDKNELLYQRGGINFNDLPTWQKRGVGVYWQTYQKDAFNPKTGSSVVATRRKIKADLNLPMKDEYSKFITNILLKEHPDLEYSKKLLLESI